MLSVLWEDIPRYCVEGFFVINEVSVDVFTILETVSIEKIVKVDEGIWASIPWPET